MLLSSLHHHRPAAAAPLILPTKNAIPRTKIVRCFSSSLPSHMSTNNTSVWDEWRQRVEPPITPNAEEDAIVAFSAPIRRRSRTSGETAAPVAADSGKAAVEQRRGAALSAAAAAAAANDAGNGRTETTERTTATTTRKRTTAAHSASPSTQKRQSHHQRIIFIITEKYAYEHEYYYYYYSCQHQHSPRPLLARRCRNGQVHAHGPLFCTGPDRSQAAVPLSRVPSGAAPAPARGACCHG